ncbi:copper-translocating P-type ATPase [Snodgrassella communis]|uniref:Heavy metal ABC transporter, ATP-binding protein n=1 Tax=Snodgrassella communis TaxID=2946699 RepID=A0A836MRF9_9NEIS|nr:heavy metal translocating P-type ATPase [Snodgrassella communis]KDN15801.1 heavy metal ABC transporter, ATP-binding protein [Snodgrassella communis]PIT11992.1 copper-translocating P-type ATPase [Snodgrassella communis]PIT28975.1 copper-translocating P-type ATPase [Snodgrassella communis]PIT29964.1 copper-translocating P-type ATPase [Snodgrassella communis]PIT33476.1 copper-translocating P-type ATPase [Snodgrassella communis]
MDEKQHSNSNKTATARFAIEGMDCQACANRIEKVLRRQQGIIAADVNFASDELQTCFDNSILTTNEIVQIIAKTGFKAIPASSTGIQTLADTQSGEHTGISWRLALIWLIAMPFIIGMLSMLLGQQWMLPPPWQFILASIIQLGFAWPFYNSAIKSLQGGVANMDVLVSLGTIAIWLYSSVMLFNQHDHAHQYIYFEASVMVIAFVSLGKYLEQRTKKQSLNSMSMLLQLTPKMVRKQTAHGWQQVPLSQIQPGDILQTNAGNRIAADGIVSSGQAWCDESYLTGESKPLLKQTGDKVLAGALLSNGSITYQAQTLGSQTLLGDMMQALAQAQGSKAPIARLADKVSMVFVPIVVAIAVLTFILNYCLGGGFNQAITRGVAVLVIACPCALGLATPAAMMVGMGRSARYGVWFKDAASLERTSQVTTVVLDKTGTLTNGKPQIIAQWCAPNSNFNSQKILQLAAAVEQLTTHPLAQAIIQAAQQQQLPALTATNSHSDIGQGTQAQIAGYGNVKVGNPAYCRFSIPQELMEQEIWQIASIVVIAINEEVAGAFAIADALKEDTISAIQRLQQHIEIQMMSGDQHSVVEHIARQLGISHYQAQMNPRAKAEAVHLLMQQGKVVAMVGDGINDAPALAAADVSFAMYGGADIATNTASATLMRHSVTQVADALALAHATVRVVKQNLFFAFFYNILGIPLAAIGWLSPVIAGAAMAMSSISVLLNALRLRTSKLN